MIPVVVLRESFVQRFGALEPLIEVFRIIKLLLQLFDSSVVS